jgi:hypothetical protein
VAGERRSASERYKLGQEPDAEQDGSKAPAPTAEQRAAYVEIAIQQAERRGDFTGLPGAGKPIRDLGPTHDPDWWMRRKIERERLTGLGPPALTLRVEHAELDDRLDAIGSEQGVREVLDDFNSRVVEARRQLLGGPPVVTPTRDVETELLRWRERRHARAEAERLRVDDEERATTQRRAGRLRRLIPGRGGSRRT